MKVELPYGRSTLTVELPDENLMKIGYISGLKGIENIRDEIVGHLRNPIGTQSLSSLVKKGDKVTVIVDDYTRPCPDDILLPPILEEFTKRGGVRKDDITIISATGLHPPRSERLTEIVGEEVIDEYKVLYHDANESEMKGFGKTSFGVPVRVNKLVADADFIFSTGFIEPHFFAGFSGGRKSIMPGVSATESIYGNHGYKMLANPQARAGVLNGNPVYDDSVEHAQKVGHNFILNVILNRDKEIGKIVAGHWLKAHIEGVRMDKQIVEVKFREKADITITTNNGYPLDLDLYQTVKGIYTAALITKKGGAIIATSECGDGVGPEDFWKLHKEAGSPEEVLETIKKEEPIGVQWENQILARVQEEGKEIYLVSGLENQKVEDFKIKPVDSVESVIDKLLKSGKKIKIAVLPEGPVSLPILES